MTTLASTAYHDGAEMVSTTSMRPPNNGPAIGSPAQVVQRHRELIGDFGIQTL
jgi:hypothetical protein